MPFDPAAQKVMDKFFTKPEPRADGQTYIDTLLARKPAYTYGEWLPYNQDPQENTSWDFTAGLPGQLLEGWNTWEKILKGQVAPYMIKDGPGDSSTPVRNPAIDQSAGALSMAVPVGSLGGTAPKGATRMFLGRNSSGADLAALGRAEQMAKSGATEAQIWKDTGWFQHEGGQWAYEVPDIGGQLKPGLAKNAAGEVEIPAGSKQPVESYLDHPELQAKGQYTDFLGGSNPLTKSLTVGLETNPQAAGSYGNSHIDMRPEIPKEFRKTMLHEISHAVDELEGFPRGGNSEQFLPQGFEPLYQKLKTQMDHLFDIIENKSFPEAQRQAAQTAFDKGLVHFKKMRAQRNDAIRDYFNLPGERNARNVEARADKPLDWLKANPPPTTLPPLLTEYPPLPPTSVPPPVPQKRSNLGPIAGAAGAVLAADAAVSPSAEAPGIPPDKLRALIEASRLDTSQLPQRRDR